MYGLTPIDSFQHAHVDQKGSTFPLDGLLDDVSNVDRKQLKTTPDQ